MALFGATQALAADYVPGEIVVGYKSGRIAGAAAATARMMGIRETAEPSPQAGVDVLRLPAGVSVPAAAARLRRAPGVAFAVPNFIAHAAGNFYPNDRGRTKHARGWEQLQWNFLAAAGIDAPQAWGNLIADRRPGGRGVVVAIVDTGVAYRNWHQFRRSPDFNQTKFVHPYDFVANNAYPLDREGHGTFVAGTVAESTNNGIGLTGLAYGASIMPVRVLDANGAGGASTISRGIRYAVNHQAQVINLSLEFPPNTTAADIPDIISALNYAHQHGIFVAAAAGNEGDDQLDYPARASTTISVGATTRDRCLASYSNYGEGLDLVAPGGGDDTELGGANCHPARNLPPVYQLTLTDPGSWNLFGYPNIYYGTSMATAHVAAAAALVIASGIVGRHPGPAKVLGRLERTAEELGASKPNTTYGYGLIDAGAATAKGLPAAQ
jgi:serine protease